MVLNGVMAVSDEIIISSVHITFEWSNAHFDLLASIGLHKYLVEF